jgi:medium-chain acyl-[acyl-carrier-protein] hydrolase
MEGRTTTRREWLLCPRPDPDAQLRLICLPYAGGRAGIFLDLAGELPDGVELGAVELPGHGGRLREVPYPRLGPLVAHLTDRLAERVDKPFVLFGYSMGGLLAFEVARELAARGLPGPRALFIAAAEAPHVSPASPPVRELSAADLIAQLGRFGSGQHSLLQNAELAAIMLPVLRADLSVCETYVYEPGPPLDCPLFAFGGTDDARVPRRSLAAWAARTTGEFSLDLLPGGHFFLDTARAAFAERLRAALTRVTEVSGAGK